LKRFFVAEAKASSSAPKTMSFSTFFSRGSAHQQASTARGSFLNSPVNIRDQTGFIDVGKCYRYQFAIDIQLKPSSLRSAALRHSLATVDRDAQFHLNVFPGKSFEVFRPLQWPVQPGDEISSRHSPRFSTANNRVR